MTDKPSDRRGTWQAAYTVLFETPEFQQLSPTAKHVLLTLRYGPQVNAICIFPLHLDALVLYTGLARAVLERALRELECRPSRGAPWIFRGDGLCWIRNGRRFNPSVSRENANHWPWINRTVAGLPRVPLVTKFKNYYGLPWVSLPPSDPPSLPESDGVTHAASHGGSTSPVFVPAPVPHTTPSSYQPPTLAHATGSNNNHQSHDPATAPVRRETAPAEWFNNCGEGRQRKCVKTEYLGRVDLGTQCDSHEKARRLLSKATP